MVNITGIFLEGIQPKVFEGTPALRVPSDVWGQNLLLKKGESCLIEASSGRGKSSLCAFLYGLRKDYSGNISFVASEGQTLQSQECDFVSLRSNNISLMFQDLKLFPELTAVENVMLKNRITGSWSEEKCRNMLLRMNLMDVVDVPCGRMSFGQQQRVAFVRALAQPLDFLFLDEPVSHLDEENARIMSQMIKERQIEDGIGVVVTSIGYRLPYDYERIIEL